MTTNVDIVNRALQAIGTRTTVTQAEYDDQTSNEAIQAALILEAYRDQLLRMAPWDCALNTENLVYISSVPGTPENTSPATDLWEKGQPTPPWVYEYQYPVDCLKACWIIPAAQTGVGGVSIFNAVTGSAPSTWLWPPIKFKVQIDQFVPVTAAVVAVGGTGHAVGDIITLAETEEGDPPIGAPAQLTVLTLTGSAVATVSVVNQIAGSATPQGGSYFERQTNPVAQGSTTGSGTGATFNLSYGAKSSQRVILTNQQDATLVYVKQITDPNLMDPLFIEAWVYTVAAGLAISLTGNKDVANIAIQMANRKIEEARKADGNEGTTVNDVVPDWIRTRGLVIDPVYGGPGGYDWGGLWPLY